MHHPDLSPIDFGGMAAIAVGWLERTHPYPKGSVSVPIFLKLMQLLEQPWQPAISAGRHPCSFCVMTGGPASLTYEDTNITVGAANLFVPADETIFIAPSLIAHYIDAHEYLPPTVFLDAVAACSPMRSIEYLRQIARHRRRVTQ